MRNKILLSVFAVCIGLFSFTNQAEAKTFKNPRGKKVVIIKKRGRTGRTVIVKKQRRGRTVIVKKNRRGRTVLIKNNRRRVCRR